MIKFFIFQIFMTTHFFSKYLNPHFYLYHHRTKDETLTNHLLFPSFLERFEQTELGLSPPQRLPLGIPIKIAIIEKIERAPRTMGRGKRREPLFFHSPSHRAPRAVFFFLLSFPTTQRGLCAGDWEELGYISGMAGLLKVRWKTWKTKRRFVATARNDLSTSL